MTKQSDARIKEIDDLQKRIDNEIFKLDENLKLREDKKKQAEEEAA